MGMCFSSWDLESPRGVPARLPPTTRSVFDTRLQKFCRHRKIYYWVALNRDFVVGFEEARGAPCGAGGLVPPKRQRHSRW